MFSRVVSKSINTIACISCQVNFFAIDRPDIQYSAKEDSKYVSSLRECDWSMVYKLDRYLRHKLCFKHVFTVCQQTDIQNINVYVDSDCVGGNMNRKSTTGVAIRLGGSFVITFSRNQKTIA